MSDTREEPRDEAPTDPATDGADEAGASDGVADGSTRDADPEAATNEDSTPPEAVEGAAESTTPDPVADAPGDEAPEATEAIVAAGATETDADAASASVSASAGEAVANAPGAEESATDTPPVEPSGLSEAAAAPDPAPPATVDDGRAPMPESAPAFVVTGDGPATLAADGGSERAPGAQERRGTPFLLTFFVVAMVVLVTLFAVRGLMGARIEPNEQGMVDFLERLAARLPLSGADRPPLERNLAHAYRLDYAEAGDERFAVASPRYPGRTAVHRFVLTREGRILRIPLVASGGDAARDAPPTSLDAPSWEALRDGVWMPVGETRGSPTDATP